MTYCAHQIISSWRLEPIEAMLGPVELTMNTSTRFNSLTIALGWTRLGWMRLDWMRLDWMRASRPTLRRISAIVLLIGSIALLQAQNADLAAPKVQNAPETLPAEPAASTAKPDAAVSAFGSYQRQIQLPSLPGYGFDLGSRSFINPFQPAVSFGSLSGSTGSALNFNLDLNRKGGVGTTRQGATSFNQLDSFSMGRSQVDPAILFPPLSVTGGLFGVTPQPSLNQLMRASFNLPLSSASNSPFRFQYSSVLMPSGGLNDLAHPYGSLLYTSSDLGNGVFLSAGTYNSGHSMAGSPAVPLGSGSGAPKHSASGVAIKLSF